MGFLISAWHEGTKSPSHFYFFGFAVALLLTAILEMLEGLDPWHTTEQNLIAEIRRVWLFGHSKIKFVSRCFGYGSLSWVGVAYGLYGIFKPNRISLRSFHEIEKPLNEVLIKLGFIEIHLFIIYIVFGH